MSEPITHSAAVGVTAYITGQSVALTILGARPEAFILGLVGAFAVCAWQEAFDKPRKTYAGIFLAMLIAGYGSPAAALYITTRIEGLTQQSLLYILPLLIGVAVPSIGPFVFKWLKAKLGGESNA